MKKLLNGTGALLLLTGILVGIPAALIALAGDPFPTDEQWNAIITLTPDYGNVIMFTKILPLVVWILWAAFAIPFLVELVAAISGRKTAKKVVAFRGQQKLAAGLIGAVAVMFAGGFGALAAPGPASADSYAVGTVGALDLSHSVTVAPAAQAPAAAPVQQQVVHQVVEGDTLWDLATQYYGQGERFVEIFNANLGVQPDGQSLTDPDLILPGWQLSIPGVYTQAPAEETPAPTTPAPTPDESVQAPATDAPVVDGADGGAGGGARGGGAAEVRDMGDPVERPAAEDAPSVDDVSEAGEEIDLAIPLMTAGGIAGLLVAGLLGALGARRLRQRRKRVKGERIALPEAEVADLELEMRMVENPIGVADIDNALRTLQAWAEDNGEQLPELLAVRVADDEVALYLAAAADLPEPFESVHEDRTAWIVRPGRAQAPDRPTVSPYPALATVGTDAQGGYVLLDLEQVGSLNVTGDEETARGMLNALACEFATNPWSDEIQVTLVGLDDSLARDLDRVRVHQVADVPALVRNLRADLDDRRDALDSYGVGGVLDARSRATDIESWAPHIVILAETPIGSLRDDLADLVARMPRLGIATIAQGAALAAGATIEVTSKDQAEYRSSGTLPPLPFRPQILAGEELELVRSLFATTEREAQPVDLAQERPHNTTTTETLVNDTAVEEATVDETPVDVAFVAEITVDDASMASVSESAGTEIEVGDETIEEPADAPATSVDVAPAAAETATADAVDEATTEPAAAEEPSVNVPDWPAPYIRLLGPVDALNVDMAALPGRGIEFLTFLLLQDTPSVPGALVQKKLWPDTYSKDNNNARQLAKPLRRILGHDPFGQPLLPEGRSSAGFTIHNQIRTDWHDFCDLIGPDLSTTPNENLVRAIRLVRGQPFDGLKLRASWWAWRGPIEETMRAAILDAADELTHRALATGKFDDARLAARVAQSADRLNEAGWRLEIETAMATGDVDAFNSIVDTMFEVIGVDTEIDDATQQLLDDAHEKLPGLAAR